MYCSGYGIDAIRPCAVRLYAVGFDFTKATIVEVEQEVRNEELSFLEL